MHDVAWGVGDHIIKYHQDVGALVRDCEGKIILDIFFWWNLQLQVSWLGNVSRLEAPTTNPAASNMNMKKNTVPWDVATEALIVGTSRFE